jgi:parallel beta-helix repeat protein
VGPADGDTVDANGVVLSCQVCQNVVGYQLLMGLGPHDLKYVISDTPTPPEDVITSFPHETIYWTIRVRDQYGSTIFPDPRRLHVDDPVAPPVENVTKGRTYTLIQDAIDEAGDGDEIVVSANGFNYLEDIRFDGRSVTLRSTDPDDPAVVAATVIEGTTQAVTFSSGEDTSCVLAGFTITGADRGIYCFGASPTITKCRIVDNSGAGIKLWEASNPTISNCVIAGNGGAGIEMWAKTGTRFPKYNYATITNCTIVGNLEHGIFGGKPTVGSSILYDNGWACGSVQIDSFNATVDYSNVQGGFTGEGNVDAEPRFVDAEYGDYHLLSASPCINAGDPNSVAGPNDVDIDGEMRVMLGRVDMGVDEFNPFTVQLDVVGEQRVGRTVFEHECEVLLTNISPFALENIQLTLAATADNTIIVQPNATFGDTVVDEEGSAVSSDTPIARVDRSKAIDSVTLIWRASYRIADSAPSTELSASGDTFLQFENSPADLVVDGQIDCADVARLAERWLWTGRAMGVPEDIAVNGVVDFADFARLAEEWEKWEE